MAKLDDTSMMILSGAAARSDMKVFPLPSGLRADEARVAKVLDKLVNTGLLAGVGATRDDVAWAEDEESGRTTLIVTPAGLRATNIEPEGHAEDPATTSDKAMPAAVKKPTTKTKPAKKPPAKAKTAKNAPAPAHKRRTSAKPGKAGVKAARKADSPRPGLTKQMVVVGMLRRANGASIEELAKAIDWQHHSVRGALTATIKGRLNLPLTSEKGEDGTRRYFIAPIRTGKDKG